MNAPPEAERVVGPDHVESYLLSRCQTEVLTYPPYALRRPSRMIPARILELAGVRRGGRRFPRRGSYRADAGEPLGEPAPPPEILDSVPNEIRRQLPDKVVDALLAGAKTEEEIVGPGGLLAS